MTRITAFVAIILAYTSVAFKVFGDIGAPTSFSIPDASGDGLNLTWSGPGINDVLTVGPYTTGSLGGSSVYLGNGAAYKTATDLSLFLNGIDWSHIRMYSSLASLPSNWQGEGWWASEMSYLTVSSGDPSDATVYIDPHFSLSFAYDDMLEQFNAPSDKYPFKLTFVSGSD